MTDYEKNARDFLKKCGVSCRIRKVGEVKGFPFDDHDTHYHNKYRVTLTKGADGKTYNFMFYDSANNYWKGERPTRYDVLACLEKYEVEADVWDFAREFGYEIHDKESYNRVCRIHKACIKQYKKLCWLFTDEQMAELQEIN